MTTPTALSDGSPARSGFTQAYAVGLNAGTHRGLRTVSHGGSWAGYRAHFLRFPDQRFAVATFCNFTAAGPDSLARQVAAVYLGDRMEPDTAGAWVAALDAAPAVAASDAEQRALTGLWRNDARGQVIRVRLVGDSLVAESPGRMPVVPLGGGRFRQGRGTELRVAASPGSPARLLRRSASDTATFVRADAVSLTATQLAAYAGEYRNDEIEATHSWRLEDSTLVLHVNGRRLGELAPSYADGFLRGGTVIDVTRDARGRITGYVVQDGRVRNLRFTRVR